MRLVTDVDGIGEKAVLFGRSSHLVGILTPPQSQARFEDLACVFLTSGIVPRVGANRIHVRLARALAEKGVLSFRFDLSGIGDSRDGGDDPKTLRGDIVKQDITDALDYLEASEGVSAFVLIGLCSGADDAIRTLLHDDRGVGAVLLDGDVPRTLGYYLRAYGPRLLRPRSYWTLTKQSFLVGKGMIRRLAAFSWGRQRDATVVTPGPRSLGASPLLTRREMRDQVARLVDRAVPLLYIFTAGLEERYNYEGQFYAGYRGLGVRRSAEVEHFADSDHTFSKEVLQARLERRVLKWIDAQFLEQAAPPTPVGTPS